MTYAEVNNFARHDHKTKDQKYNRGLKLILEFGYEYMSADDNVQYYCMCNNITSISWNLQNKV